MEARVQQYVPGYRLKADPVVQGDRVTVFIEVEGAGRLFASVRRQLGHYDERGRASRSPVGAAGRQCRLRCGAGGEVDTGRW